MMGAVFAEHRESRYSQTAVAERDVQNCGTHWTISGLVRLPPADEAPAAVAPVGEAAELLSAAVRCGVRIPLAEHDLLACWLSTPRPPTDDGLVHGVPTRRTRVAADVPW